MTAARPSGPGTPRSWPDLPGSERVWALSPAAATAGFGRSGLRASGSGAQPRRSGLLEQPDPVPLGIQQHGHPGRLRDRGGWLHDLAAQPPGPLQVALEPLDAGIERHVLADRVAGGIDAARDAALAAGVDHPVALGVVGVDLPAEQLAVEAGEDIEVAPGDLEPHHWCGHRYLLCRWADLPRVGSHGDSVLSGFAKRPQASTAASGRIPERSSNPSDVRGT